MKTKSKVVLILTTVFALAVAGTASADPTMTASADPPTNLSQIGWTANAHGSCSGSCAVIFRYRWNNGTPGPWSVNSTGLTPECGAAGCDWAYSENNGVCTTGPLFGNLQYQIGVKDTSQPETELQWYGPDGTSGTVENC